MTAHTAVQIISIVTVETTDSSSAVATALAVVSSTLDTRLYHPAPEQTVVADLHQVARRSWCTRRSSALHVMHQSVSSPVLSCLHGAARAWTYKCQ